MHTWKTHLAAVLGRLADTHAQTPIGEIRTLLASVLETEDFAFIRPDGTPLPPDTPLRSALAASCHVRVTVAPAVETGPRPAPPPSRFRAGQPPAGAATPAEREEAFIREFARLSHRHDFMWAGYVVRELLPRVGFPAAESKVVLDRLCADGILTMSKVPNPKNPGFPATGVSLNLQHPRVRAALESVPEPSPPADAPVPADPGPA